MLIYIFIIVLCCLLLVFVAGSSFLSKKHLERRLSNLNNNNGQSLINWQSLLTSFSHILVSKKELARLEKLLMNAGFFKTWQLDLFILVRISLIVVALIAGFMFFDLDFRRPFAHPFPFLKLLLLVFVAGRAPEWFLNELKKRRQTKIRLFIPKTVDLLTICIDCGMSLEDAFSHVAEEVEDKAPEIANEFKITRYDMMIVDRLSALKRMEKRSGVREMELLSVSLQQSIQYGTPLAEALRNIAKEARDNQLSELEQKAGKVSATIGIPLIVLVLFPVIVLIAAPAVINLVRAF